MSNYWYMLRQCAFDPVVFRESLPTKDDKQRFRIEVLSTLLFASENGMHGLHAQEYLAPVGAVNMHHTFFGRLATILGLEYQGVIDGQTINMQFVKPPNYNPPPFVRCMLEKIPIPDLTPADDPFAVLGLGPQH